MLWSSEYIFCRWRFYFHANWKCTAGCHLLSCIVADMALLQLPSIYPTAQNFHMAVETQGDNMVFLHKVVKGPCQQRSYGLWDYLCLRFCACMRDNNTTAHTFDRTSAGVIILLIITSPARTRHFAVDAMRVCSEANIYDRHALERITLAALTLIVRYRQTFVCLCMLLVHAAIQYERYPAFDRHTIFSAVLSQSAIERPSFKSCIYLLWAVSSCGNTATLYFRPVLEITKSSAWRQGCR